MKQGTERAGFSPQAFFHTSRPTQNWKPSVQTCKPVGDIAFFYAWHIHYGLLEDRHDRPYLRRKWLAQRAPPHHLVPARLSALGSQGTWRTLGCLWQSGSWRIVQGFVSPFWDDSIVQVPFKKSVPPCFLHDLLASVTLHFPFCFLLGTQTLTFIKLLPIQFHFLKSASQRA